MNNERLMKVILAPLVTEKTQRVADSHKQIAFKVTTDATKPEIRAAVELLFKVKVEAVSAINVKGKKKRFGRHEGQRKNWKKAYVTLAEGHDINFVGAES